MKYPILLTYFVFSLLLVALPLPWWYYSVGGIIVVYDSPFQISISLFNKYLILSLFLNVFLNAFRIYVAVNIIYGIIMAIKGKAYKYSTMFWLPLLYFLDPIIIYVIMNYVINYLLKIPIKYPFFIMGTETLLINYQGSAITMTVVFEPTRIFWVSFISVFLYIGYLIFERRKV